MTPVKSVKHLKGVFLTINHFAFSLGCVATTHELSGSMSDRNGQLKNSNSWKV